MNLNEIKELMQEFDKSGIHKLSLELEDMKLKLEKETIVQNVVAAAPAAAPAMPSMPQMPAAAPAAEPAAPALSASGTPVKSPVVGTFYSASAPGAKPFVTVGDHVVKGQTLCIVEAMKMMNEIVAPVAGTVKEILVQEEEMVQFDQTIMLIEE